MPFLNAAFFELGALPYDLVSRHRVWRAHCRRMLRWVPETPNRRVILDLGCGPGVSAIEEKRAARPGDVVVGLDLSGAMMRRARDHVRRAGVEVELVRGDALELPVRDGAVDAITGHSFLYLLPDRRRALAEALRVLAPGGTLVLLEPAWGFGLSGIARFLPTPRFAFAMACWRLASGAAGRFTHASLATLLEDAGFERVTVTTDLNGLGLLAVGRKPVAA